MNNKVCVALLNWNGKHLLEKFLPSIVKYSDEAEIVVIDNGSDDDSVAFLHKHYSQVRVISLGENHGFAGGYNLGLEYIDAEYVVLLNTDVEVTEGWLNPLLECMESRSDIAVCQPKILDYHRRNYFEYAGAAGGFIDVLGYPFCRGRIFFTIEQDTGQYDDVRPVFWVAGACMMIRKSLFREAGGFDANFFAHMEEIDLCWRLRNMGYEIMVVPQSVVYHVGGATLSMKSPKKTFLNFRNNYILIAKNQPSLRAGFLLGIRFMLDWLACVLFLFRRSMADASAVIFAQWNFIRHLRLYLKNKPHVQQYSRRCIYRRPIIVEYYFAGKRCFTKFNQKLFM